METSERVSEDESAPAPKKRVKRVKRVRRVAKQDAPREVPGADDAPQAETETKVKTIKRVRKTTAKAPVKRAKKPAAKPAPKPEPGKKQRVFELARELGVTSKDIVEKSKAEGVDVKSHMTTVQTSLVGRITGWFKK